MLIEITTNAPKFICPNCLLKPKSLVFQRKKSSLGVTSPWLYVSCKKHQIMTDEIWSKMHLCAPKGSGEACSTNWADSYVVNLSVCEEKSLVKKEDSNFLNITGCGSFFGHNFLFSKVKILANWLNKMTTCTVPDELDLLPLQKNKTEINFF